MNHNLPLVLLRLAVVACFFGLFACGGDDRASPQTSPEDGTSNGTTATSNQTTATSNGTTATSNGTTATSNGTTATSNGTTSTHHGLSLDNTKARACEVMVVDADQRLSDVVFNTTVEGRSIRRGKHLALAFTATSDAPLPLDVVSFAVEGSVEGVSMLTGRCFDREGAPIETPNLTLRF